MKAVYNILICGLLSFLTIPFTSYGQTIRGYVKSASLYNAIPDVSIYDEHDNGMYRSDENGAFPIRVLQSAVGDFLRFSHVGYHDLFVRKDSLMRVGDGVVLYMQEFATDIETVEINTGYYTIPKERSTGSFERLDNRMFERTVGTDVISRLEGNVPGLHFDRRSAGGVSGQDDFRKLRLRGVNTVFSEESPLIILDNFPYDGDVNDINPNDIESVTVLKDAAAASIWGVKAGNGVIVLTTKKGQTDMVPRINLNVNYTMSPRPNLFYGKNFIDARNFLELERYLFENKVFETRENDANMPYLSPGVELLIRERDGEITSSERTLLIDKMSEQDIRNDVQNYLYRAAAKQQYSVSWSGNTQRLGHRTSLGYDRNAMSNVGNSFSRLTLSSNTDYQLSDRLTLGTHLLLGESANTMNGMDVRNLATYLPYERLVDGTGEWLAVGHTYRSRFIAQAAENGLLDWQYRPLQELSLNDVFQKRRNVRVNARLSYEPIQRLKVSLDFLHQKELSEDQNQRDKESYYVRNMVNRYTQENGIQAFPYGDILERRNGILNSNNVRLQLNYSNRMGNEGEINLLAGGEVRQVKTDGESFSYYGYDSDVLTVQPRLNYTTNYPLRPLGNGFIPVPPQFISALTDRYLSYYFNGSYSYRSRYTISSSVRWDASNLFGVSANQKGTPLWSVGMAWNVANEDFMNFDWLSNFKVRLTHGVSGNINKMVTAFPTVLFTTGSVGNLPSGIVQSPGNPDLRWERVYMTNVGLDLGIADDLLTVAFEYYSKKGKDIFGQTFIDPTIFYGGNTARLMMNYADIDTRGYDLSLAVKPIGNKLKWGSTVFFSGSRNKLVKYNGPDYPASSYAYGTTNRPVEGNSVDMLYSLPWYGLDPNTGDPLVREVSGEIGKEYTRYLNSMEVSDMIQHGSSVPLIFGLLRQSLTYHGLTASVSFGFKGKYFFRRNTVSYNNLLNGDGSGMHSDYEQRWQNSGDEQFTDVPSIVPNNIANRDLVYALSERLVEPGDHIRLQDIRLDYRLRTGWKSFKSLQFYGFASNLGVLWRKTKSGIDPDYPSARFYLPPATYSLGIKLEY